ncbi:hypothetical protein AB1L42_21240 [Thalassoglobus sp. JC818]|uniref:hypothetical protein n=1 Tax=Thalassoglobus sp. JC818 TaxID=3232136 RepID=UPI0034596B01
MDFNSGYSQGVSSGQGSIGHKDCGHGTGFRSVLTAALMQLDNVLEIDGHFFDYYSY